MECCLNQFTHNSFGASESNDKSRWVTHGLEIMVQIVPCNTKRLNRNCIDMHSIRIQPQLYPVARRLSQNLQEKQNYALNLSNDRVLEKTESSLQKPSQKTTNCRNKSFMRKGTVNKMIITRIDQKD